jgi:hypothetical protein
MRSLLWAVLPITLLAATPVAAQPSDLSGTWAFQTQPYGDQQFGVVMSGVAIATRSAPGRYDIRLLANELIMDRASGRSQVITARQTCTGEDADGQVNITCQMAEPLEGYQPDNFVLQRGEADQLVGVLSSTASGQVTFTRVR